MKTNFLKSLFAIACLLCSLGVYAHDFEVDGIYYNKLSSTEVEVSYRGYYYDTYDNEYKGLVVIPASITYNGTTYNVTSIGGYAFAECTGLTEIIIGNSVTSIGSFAFARCFGLTEITIPNSVTSIGSSAFSGCTVLGSVTIGNSVTSIGSSAFSGCSGFTEVAIPNSVTSIGSSAFSGCTGLTSVTIPNRVTSIGEEAFSRCTGLTTLNFNAENCTTMGSYSDPVFKGCSNLKTLNIGESVKIIPDYAFYDCTGLKVYCLPIVPPSISSSTFKSSAIINLSLELLSKYLEADIWKSLKLRGVNNGITYYPISATTLEVAAGDTPYSGDVIIPETITHTEGVYTITSIGNYAFSGCTGLTEVTIPNSVTSIGAGAFYGCTGLTEVTIPNSVTSIGESAFENCTGLTTLNFNAENCTTMGSSSSPVFEGCTNLKTLNIGESVKAIPKYAFSGCTGLTEVTIPNSVTSIGYYAFRDCTGLKEVTIPNSVTSIGENAFSGCTGLTSVTIPNSVTSIGERAFRNCTGLTTLNFNAENCTTMGSSSYPVFEGCTNLKTLNIGESVKIIPDYAFRKCSGLTSVTIPNSVTSIGKSAFSNCTGLTTLNFNAENCTTMGSSSYPVFSGCSNLTAVNIGESVKTILDDTFANCTGLTSLTIGNSVTSIGSDAFYGCNIAKTIWLTNTPPSGYKNVSSKVHYVANEQYTGLSNVKIYPYISSLFETGGVKYVPVSPSERTCDAIDCCYDSTATIMQIDSVVLYKGVAMTVKEVMPYTLYNQDYIKTLSINNSGNVGKEAFYSCENLTTATLGDSIKSIGSNAFENCTTLSEIVIPNGVISIGESAFNGCTNMTKAIVGNGVTSISSSAFGGCASVYSIYIGRKVATVGKNAFSGCKKLPNITIPAGVTTIDDYVFSGCTSLSDVVIEDRTTALSLGSNGSSGLFADCPLDSVYIGGKITYKTSSSYGYSPFYRNTSLCTVVITDTETEIYDNEFYGCSNLTKVTIGDGVKKIGNWAFSGCSSLDHFAFGTNVESIGQEAFSDCTNVTNIRSYSAVPPVCGTQALDDINKWNCTLSVLENCQSAYQTAEQWKEFFFVNAMDKDGKVVAPVIVVESVVVTISCETAKTTIYYTTDGSEPTVESALYTGPFVVDKNCTIKAIAVRTNYYNSDVSTAQVDYFVYAESIVIDYETVSIRLNESVTLTATVLPETTTDKGVVWSSSDENIATVENGIVTAHAIGETTITATTTDGTNLSATCKVTVLPILADTITLDQTEIVAIAGETVVLTATIYPDDATEKGVVWSISDATIATIEPIDNVSAKVTMLKEGVATITATTIDGSNLSATCTIDVSSDIEALLRDSEDVEYYDLNGFRIENPTRGIYIVKQGNTVKKVVL